MTNWGYWVAAYFAIGIVFFVLMIAIRVAEDKKPDRGDAFCTLVIWPALLVVAIGVALGNALRKASHS